jgi:hypothetical protein
MLRAKAKAEEERRQREERERERNRPMPLYSAASAARALDGRMLDPVDRGLLAALERRGVKEISVNDLRQKDREWKANRCPQCEGTGMVGSPVQKTLAFCGCAAGQEWQRLEPAAAIDQIANANRDIATRLIAACRELNHDFASDSLEESEITETATEVIVSVPREFSIGITPGILESLMRYIEDPRRAVLKPQHATGHVAA